MPSFNYLKKLGSHKVDKELISLIERFLLEVMPNTILKETPAIIQPFKISLQNKYSREEFNSMAEYKYPYFKDDVSLIALNFKGTFEGKTTTIAIRFSSDSESTDLSIYSEFEAAQEITASIEKGLELILHEKKTHYWLLFPHWFISLLSFVFGTYYFIKLIDSSSTKQEKAIAAFYLLTVGLYYFFQHLIGFCLFETKKHKQIDKWFNWLLFGYVSFILFTTIFSIIRKSFLGF